MTRSLDLQDLAHMFVLGSDYQIAFNVASIDTVPEGRCAVSLRSLASEFTVLAEYPDVWQSLISGVKRSRKNSEGLFGLTARAQEIRDHT